MRRRKFLTGGAAMLALPRLAGAQGKMWVVGLLWNDSVKPSPLVEVLLTALREKGWLVGRNLRVEDRISLEGYGGYAEGLKELVRAKVDVIVTSGATATQAAAKATKDIPIVMRIGGDPVASGLVASLSRPGGNITGITTVQVGLNGKRIQLLKELVPNVARVGVLVAAETASYILNVRESEAAAQALNLQVQIGEVRSLDEIEGLVGHFRKLHVGAVYVPGSTMLASHGERVAGALNKHRLPAVYANDRFVEAGGLMVYSASTGKSFMRLAGYVDRVLKGVRPADLAIEQASDVELVVNLKTANGLGIRIPQSILVRADRVIE
jgi:putative tryptophan/tyrosine transport system substrate-binding protein